MTPDRVTNRRHSDSRVLPFRGDEDRVPSTVLVREALSLTDTPRDLVRAAMAVAAGIAEGGTGRQGVIVEGPAGIAMLVDRSGLSAAEVTAALNALRTASAVSVREGVVRLDPDLCCMLPVLAAVNWEECRRSIAAAGGRLAPSLGLLRELGRVSSTVSAGGGDWLHPSIQDLVDETLYGRTAVTQALGDLVRAALVVRTEQPARKGLRIRLAADAFGPDAQAPPNRSGTAIRSGRYSNETPGRSAVAGVTVEIGGAAIGVPEGSRLQLPPGMDYRLEIGPDGGAIIRIDD